MSSQSNTISGTQASVAAGTAAVLAGMAHAQGSDKIKVGMLGGGGRNNGAVPISRVSCKDIRSLPWPRRCWYHS